MTTFAVYISANKLYAAIEVTNLTALAIDKKEAIKKAIAEGFKD